MTKNTLALNEQELRMMKSMIDALGITKTNSKGQLVFKSLTAKQKKAGLVESCFDRYSLRRINKIMAETNLILIDPDNVQVSGIDRMLFHAWNRNFIPTFFGRVEGADFDSDRYDITNFNTLSFGVFTGANAQGENIDFLFAYLSQSEDEWDLDSELEDYRLQSGRTISIVDSLNDMFAQTAGVDYSLFYTCKIKEIPEFQEALNQMKIFENSEPPPECEEIELNHSLNSDKE